MKWKRRERQIGGYIAESERTIRIAGTDHPVYFILTRRGRQWELAEMYNGLSFKIRSYPTLRSAKADFVN